MAQVKSRALTSKKVKKLTAAQETALADTKIFYDRINQSLTAEVIKSSTLEVVTESTLQPLLQLYAMTSTCNFSDMFTSQNLLGPSLFTNSLLFSVVTSLLSFSWSMTTYHVYAKQGALGIGSNLKGRLQLFSYFLVYIISRMFILIIAAHQVFGGFEYFLIFVFLHVILMFGIHYLHLYKMNIQRNHKSLSFWIESLNNAFGSILIPNNIKYPRVDGKKINHRYHEPTSFRYLAMHLIFFLENIILVTLSTLNIEPLNQNSYLRTEFENRKNPFIKMFPLWTLGLFFLALMLKFLYYQTHAWPIGSNCFTMKFLCPFDRYEKVEAQMEMEQFAEGNIALILECNDEGPIISVIVSM